MRNETELLRSKRQEMLRNEQHTLDREIIRRMHQEVLAIAHKALADLAGTRLEERMSEVFTRRLRELSSQERTMLTVELKSSSHPAIVRSAFELPQPQRAAIESAIKDVLAIESPIQFETSPELISGIEMSANGHKVAWNIADYLTSLEKIIGQLLEEKPRPDKESDEHAA